MMISLKFHPANAENEPRHHSGDEVKAPFHLHLQAKRHSIVITRLYILIIGGWGGLEDCLLIASVKLP